MLTVGRRRHKSGAIWIRTRHIQKTEGITVYINSYIHQFHEQQTCCLFVFVRLFLITKSQRETE